MAKILEFRPPAPKPLTQADIMAQELTPKEAVDQIILGMLEIALPKWVEQEWPFRQLELMIGELRYAMEANVPKHVTRKHVAVMVEHLKPSWIALMEDIEPSFFW